MNRARRGFIILAVAGALISTVAFAQEGKGDVVYVPTPQITVDEMLKMAKIDRKSVV